MNAIVFGGGIRGRNQKTTACLKGISVREFQLSALTAHNAFIIILSQYNVFLYACHTLHDAHLVVRQL